MEIRRPLEWHCKQMDHFVGLNFSANFNFALVGHLLKGKENSSADRHRLCLNETVSSRGLHQCCVNDGLCVSFLCL